MKNNPRPIGYTEVQRSWLGSDNPDMALLMLNEVYGQMARDEPELMPYGSRVEMSFDGAGVEHYTIYVGFVPRTNNTPALDPRNLNDSEPPPIGAVGPDMAIPVGWKESKFGRGT
jgi:hypothetical protein